MVVSFNLVDAPWIPVLRSNGSTDRLGIRQTLLEAGRIRQIAASNPMDRVAILRLLLALLYWCKGNPPEVASVDLHDQLPSGWFSKLDQNKHCFELLGDGKRFYQYRKSDSDRDEKLSANYLVQEVPTGTNHWHFRHSTDRVTGLCPACCAMGLLRLPLFATSGGRGKPPGVNSKPPLYVIPVGVSLAETLRLSWRPVSDLGIPAWEKPDLELPRTGKVPVLMGLTWLPRRVWLDNPEKLESDCISCGCRERLLRLSVFAPIGSTRTPEGVPGRIWRDPHVVYAASAKGEVSSLDASDSLRAADASAGQWAKIIGGIMREAGQGQGEKVWVVGFSTVKNDKYLEAREWLMCCPHSCDEVAESIAKFDRWQKEGGRLGKLLTRSEPQGVATIAAIRPHVEDRVSAKVGDLIAGSDEAWKDAASEYRPMMETIANSLSPGFTVAALQRRRKIAGAIPNMRPRTEAARKPGRKDGGKK